LRNAYKIVVGKPEGKRSLEAPRLGWDDNIEVDVIEIWIRFIWPMIGAVEHGNKH
jgi:hypothetical protein